MAKGRSVTDRRYTLQQRELLEQIEKRYYNKKRDSYQATAFNLLALVQQKNFAALKTLGFVYKRRNH